MSHKSHQFSKPTKVITKLTVSCRVLLQNSWQKWDLLLGKNNESPVIKNKGAVFSRQGLGNRPGGRIEPITAEVLLKGN